MMFEDMPRSAFNPMRDVWMPLDLSNAASFYAIMAHASAHLVFLRGQRSSSQALKFKTEAMVLVNQWMSNPEQRLCDDTFAAVLRLLTFEVSICYLIILSRCELLGFGFLETH